MTTERDASPTPGRPRRERWPVAVAALSGVLMGMLLTGQQTARAAWEQVAFQELVGADPRVPHLSLD